MNLTKSVKTNFARMLDDLGIQYQIRNYEVDPHDLTAVSVARKIGLPVEQVFKTLLTHSITGVGARDKDYFFAVIPGHAELDLKKLAHTVDVKKIELAALKDVEPLTGYVRGGVTVMGARKSFPAYADETIELYDLVSVSAGLRGAQVLLTPSDYLRATGAILADLAKPMQEQVHA